MAVLSPTKVSSSRWHLRAQKSSRANTFQHGEVFSLPVRLLDKLYELEYSVGYRWSNWVRFTDVSLVASIRYGEIWSQNRIVHHLGGSGYCEHSPGGASTQRYKVSLLISVPHRAFSSKPLQAAGITGL